MPFVDDTNPYINDVSTPQGDMTLSEFQFPAIPGLKGTIGNVMSNSFDVAPIVRVEVWQDTEPLFDEYLVRVWTLGSPEQTGTGEATRAELQGALSGSGASVQILPALAAIPLLLILKWLAVIGIGALIATVVWKVSRISANDAGEFVSRIFDNPLALIGIGLAGLGAAMFFISSRGGG